MDLILDENVHNRIIELCKEGDNLFDNNLFSAAIEKYNCALSLLPDPKEQWDAYVWIVVAKGDAYYCSKNYDLAIGQYTIALIIDRDNPYINMRLGESYFEINDMSESRKYILKAKNIDRNVFDIPDIKYLVIFENGE